MTDTNNIIDSATAETILKWAVTILVAGFIAQFGKKFATYLIDKVKAARGRKKGETGGIAAETASTDRDRYLAASRAAAEKARLKMEKKKLKNEAKARKK